MTEKSLWQNYIDKFDKFGNPKKPKGYIGKKATKLGFTNKKRSYHPDKISGKMKRSNDLFW